MRVVAALALGLAMVGTSSAAPAAPTPAHAASTARQAALEPWTVLFRLQHDGVSTAGEFVAWARSSAGRQVVVLVEPTVGWGCPCPTWVFPFYAELAALRFVMVLPAPSLALDPTDYARPGVTFRLDGRFSGETITGTEWVARRGRVPPNYPRGPSQAAALREYWSEPGLAFIVDRWCFEDNGQSRDRRALRTRGARPCPD